MERVDNRMYYSRAVNAFKALIQKSTFKSTRMFLVLFLILLALSSLKAYQAYREASSFNEYVSDEVWYVPSARNMAVKIFHHDPLYEISGRPVYTFVFSDRMAVDECLERLENPHVYPPSILIVKKDYSKLNALSVAIGDPERLRSYCPGILEVMPGYPLPDKENINSYLNLEHPPLGKYLIMLSMLGLGDKPLSWRIPGIIEAFLIVVLSGLIGWRLLGFAGGLVSGLAAFYDPLTTHMSSIAMLDIHLGFFTLLTAFFFVYDRPLLAVLTGFLASMVKYSGFFALPFLYVFLRRRGHSPLRVLSVLMAAGLPIVLLLNYPLIQYFGVERFVSEFIGALKWHTTSRPPGPTASNPLDWIIGWNSFMLHVSPDIYARGSPVVYAPGLIVSLLVFPLFLSRKTRGFSENVSGLSFLFLSILAGYFFTMASGNRTLYSFYMSQPAPILYPLLPASIALLMGYKGLLDRGIDAYRVFVRRLIKGKLGSYDWPSELKFFERIRSTGWRGQAVMAGFLLVAAVSFIIHYPFSGKPLIYSDYQWLASGRMLSEDPGRLMGVQGLVDLLLAKGGVPVKLFLTIDAFVLLVIGNEYLIYARRRGLLCSSILIPASLSLMLYGVYDGTIISALFFMMGLNMLFEGRSYAPVFLAAGSGNPVLLASGLVLASKSMRDIVIYTVSYIFLATPIVISTGASTWLHSFEGLFGTPSAPSILLPLGPYSLVSIPLLVLALYLVRYRIGLEQEKVYLSALLSTVISFLLIPSSYPQWFIVPVLLSLPFAKRWIVEQLLSDYANAFIILLWFINSTVTHALFKYTPKSPLDPWGTVTLASYIRDILLFLIVIRAYLYAERLRKHA